MLNRQYNALQILKEGCALIPKDFKQYAKMNEAHTHLIKLFEIKNEDLHKHYINLTADQQKKIRSAVDIVRPLLLLTLEKEKYYPEHYSKVYDALRLLAHYFPTTKINEEIKLLDNSSHPFLTSREHMFVYAVICSASLVNNYAIALRRRSYPDGLSDQLFLDMMIPFSKHALFYGVLATISLTSENYKKLHMFVILLVMMPTPAMTIYHQSKQEKEVSLILILAGTLLSVMAYAGAALSNYIVNKFKFQIDPQKEAFFNSLLPFPDEMILKKSLEKKKIKTNTACILKNLSLNQQLSQPVRNKSSAQEESGSTKYSRIFEPQILEPKRIDVQPAPSWRKFNFGS